MSDVKLNYTIKKFLTDLHCKMGWQAQLELSWSYEYSIVGTPIERNLILNKNILLFDNYYINNTTNKSTITSIKYTIWVLLWGSPV